MKAGQQKFPRLEILPDAQMRLCQPLGSVSGNGRERLYENICRRAGIQLTYCAEQFENDAPKLDRPQKHQARHGRGI